MDQKISVVVVDDHQVLRKGLIALLSAEDDIEVVGEANNGVRAVMLAEVLNPQVILMDISMPILNGFEASLQILKKNPSAKILILSGHSEDGYLEKIAKVGISGFLLKVCSPHFLVEAVRALSIGGTFFSPGIAERLPLFQKNKEVLSGREREVIQLIAEGAANKQVASALQISIKTVEKHRQNLMKKLFIHDTAGITRYAIAERIIEPHR